MKLRKLCAAAMTATLLLTSAVFPTAAAEAEEKYTPENGSFLFTTADSLDYLSHAHNMTAEFNADTDSVKMTVTGDGTDPRILIDFKNTVSADTYKFLVFTYMVPTSSSARASAGELFLSAGSTKLPSAGKSVKYNVTKGSAFVSERFDLRSQSWWNGEIHNIRLDIFDNGAAGDTMYVDSVILCKNANEAEDAVQNRYIAKGGKESVMSKDYYCTSYEWEKYTSPFWKGGIVYNEAIYPQKAQDGTAVYKLMYTPDVVTGVYDAQFKVRYREGVDYKIEGDRIKFLAAGSMPIKEYTYLHPTNDMIPAGYNGWSPYYKRHAAGDGKYEYWTADVAKQYINVTYTHSDSWNGPVPEQHASSLPHTASEISNGGNLNIVYYGDSLCGGARSSSYENLYPYAEWWNRQITTRLQNGYGVNVNATYSSVGGSTASSMSSADTIQKYITPYNPDLVVIEFGVNDSQNEAVGGGNLSKHKSTYKSAVMSIINQIRANTPNCEFLLVAPYYSNIYLFKDIYFEACRDALNEIASAVGGCAVADVTTIHDYLLGFKNYADFTGDNLCHPNDYMSRIFSQVCLEAIVPGGVSAYVPTGSIGEPDAPGADVDPTVTNTSYASPDGHGWYWDENNAYCLIGNYGKNGQDIILSADICLLPASQASCAHLFTDDKTGGIWIYPDKIIMGADTVGFNWGSVSRANWRTVTFEIKNGNAKVYVDGKLAATGSGFTVYTSYQMLFSHYGSMAIDNLSLRTSSGTTLMSCDFENESTANNYMGGGLGTYSNLAVSTLKFDANGGTGSIPNQIKLEDINLAVTAAKPTREGYTFLGWSRDKNAAEPEFLSGAAYTANSSATLYAVWKNGDAHEHVFGEWVRTAEPTCTESGTEERSCQCGEKETRTVPPKGHIEGETEVTPATCTENGRSLVCCTVCGYHISDVPILATGHKFVSGVCTVCGAHNESFVLGDVDLDGKVTAKDTNLVKRAIIGAESLTKPSQEAADMNGDGKITATDANLLRKKITGGE